MTKNRSGAENSGRKSIGREREGASARVIVQRTVAQIPWRSNVPLDRG